MIPKVTSQGVGQITQVEEGPNQEAGDVEQAGTAVVPELTTDHQDGPQAQEQTAEDVHGQGGLHTNAMRTNAHFVELWPNVIGSEGLAGPVVALHDAEHGKADEHDQTDEENVEG